jgi:hypothetical protein
MRRVMPPQRLRIHRGTSAPSCEIGAGPEGLTLGPVPLPDGAWSAPWPHLTLSVASPYPTHGLSVAAGGTMVLSRQPGVVQAIVLPDLSQAFDRRPPGLAEALGAGRANAAVLRADDGWRAVVLPSLGDRLSDLGPGPVAISASGRLVAVFDVDRTVVVPLGGGPPVADYPGAVDALAFAGERLWLAAGGVVGPAEAHEHGWGAHVRQLAGAAASDRVLVLHADHQVSRFGTDEAQCTWTPALPDIREVSLSDDGEWATLAAPDAVAVVRASDGAVAVYVRGASSIALAPDRRIVVGGTWGMALIVPVEETA